MDPSSPFDSTQERDCSSALGLFEKFKLDFQVHASHDGSDSDVQVVSEWASPHTSAHRNNPKDLTCIKLNDGNTERSLPKSNDSMISSVKTSVDMDPSGPFGSTQERDCSSPLGLFEKFKLDSHVHTSDDGSDSDVQFVSEWASPHIIAHRNNRKDLARIKLHDGNTERALPKGNDSMVRSVKTRREGQFLKLTGSWNQDSKEIEILDELEEVSDEPEQSAKLQQLDDDDDDMDSVVICQLNGHLSHLNASSQPFEKKTRNEQQESPEPLGSKKHLCKRIPPKKPYVREKTSGSLTHRLTFSMSKEHIRTTTVQTLSDVLLNRVQETENLHVEVEEVKKLAKNVEQEMFNLFHDTGIRYKNKYRSLIFNLKDPKNKIFFHRVVVGEISAQSLIRMSTTEMAGQDLLDWRNQERRHTLEIIERAEKDFQHNQQKTKLTHKGLIEIETSSDQMFTLEDLSDTTVKDQTLQNSILPEMTDTTAQHKSHLLDVNCLICMGKIVPSNQMDNNLWTHSNSEDITLENRMQELLSQTEIQMTEKNDNLDDNTKELLQAVWKGSIRMFSIRHFKVMACQVSGYSTLLCQELPDIITCKGLICPESVWEFLDLIWPACTKDMCLLRLCPRSAGDAISYKRLFFYLSGKLRYAIIRTQKMEAFLVPLPANQPIPAKLRPLGGPGLEDGHPNLLLALLLPNHPSWTSCPKKIIHKQREEFDIPDDIFTSIMEDVEREEMASQGLPPVGLPSSEQASEIGEVGMQELMSILSVLTNNLHEMAGEAQNTNYNYTFPGQQNAMPEMSQYCQSYNMVPSFQASSTSNPATMFDPSTWYGPPNFCPFKYN